MSDLSKREIWLFAPILILVFWMGVYPEPFLSRIEPSVKAVLARVEAGRIDSAEVAGALSEGEQD